jgi:putative drug exporter of the RND superfamily
MSSVVNAVIGAVTGRRSKWLVLFVWLLVGVASVPLAGKLSDVTVNDQKSSLPANADSAKVVDLQSRFPGADTLPALVFYHRAGGLTAQDKALVRADAAKLQALRLPGKQGVFPGPASPDGRATFLTVPLRTAGDLNQTITDAQGISRAVGTGSGGLQIRVTGPAGLLADTASVFTNINATLLLASVLVVAVLLLITYRSPFLWLVPLLAVGLFADTTSRALAYLLASRFGLHIDGQVAGITIVLVFGAGTDYALLLISRYREELRRHRDKHEAMATALRQAGPAILASGLTVSLALLTLLFAVLNSNRGLGPLAALGVFMAMVAMLTALPPLLLAFPRGIFWPLVPRYGSASAEATGFWARFSRRLFSGDARRRPRLVALVTVTIMALMALGLTQFHSDLSRLDFFRGHVQSVEGQRLLAASYPGGLSAPTTVIAPSAQAEAAMAAARRVPGVAAVPAAQTRNAAGLTQFQVVLADDPYSTAAWHSVTNLRAALGAAAPGALVGGDTAQNLDVHDAALRDTLVVAPLVLLVVFVILAILLRSLVAPVMLVATVILSFAATLGFSVLVFNHLFGFNALDAGTPLGTFVFLVALGVDYNIFLMTRVREETVKLGTREGLLRALAVTGGVITSAGLVLAGTFAVLAVLPLVVLTQFGFIVAFGVLFDTFVVRTVLVPALTLWLGPRVWWPHALAVGEAAPSQPGLVASGTQT